MNNDAYTSSPSGVRIAADFRDNLIIDRYDPAFADMRAGKIEHMRSENSEDAVTWNVFRSLRQIEPIVWLPELIRIGLPLADPREIAESVVNLWCTIVPPPSLRSTGAEGPSEIDVVIENPYWVWFIEAKYKSDISLRTTTRDDRDQILRNIDVGSYYAGVRDFYFSLLVRDRATSPIGSEAIERYSNLENTRATLSRHRPDRLANLKAVTLLSWTDLGEVLQQAHLVARRTDESGYAERALKWMAGKHLVDIG